MDHMDAHTETKNCDNNKWIGPVTTHYDIPYGPMSSDDACHAVPTRALLRGYVAEGFPGHMHAVYVLQGARLWHSTGVWFISELCQYPQQYGESSYHMWTAVTCGPSHA